MALIKCHECGGEVSTEADKCPKCGAAPKKGSGVLSGIGGGLVILLVLWYFFGGGFIQTSKKTVDDIYGQVSRDAVTQYKMVKRNGATPVEVCVQAGMVSTAFLQAKDELNYKRWADQERSDCAKAGMPK